MRRDKRPLLCDDTEFLLAGITSLKDARRFFSRDWIDIRDIPDRKRRDSFTSVIEKIVRHAKEQERSLTVPFFNAVLVYGKDSYRKNLYTAHELAHLRDMLRKPIFFESLGFNYMATNPLNSPYENFIPMILWSLVNFCGLAPLFELSATWLTEYEKCATEEEVKYKRLAEKRKKTLEEIVDLDENEENLAYIESWKAYQILKKTKLQPKRLVDETYKYVARSVHIPNGAALVSWCPLNPIGVLQDILKNLEEIETGDKKIEHVIRESHIIDWLYAEKYQVLNTEVQRESEALDYTTEHLGLQLRELKNEGMPLSIGWAVAKATETVVLLDVEKDGIIEDLKIGIPKGVPDQAMGFLIDMKLVAFKVFNLGNKCVRLLWDRCETVSPYGVDIKFPELQIDESEMRYLLDGANYERDRLNIFNQAKDVWKNRQCRKYINKWMTNLALEQT